MGAWDAFLDALFSVRSVQQFLVLYKKNGEFDGGETGGIIASMWRMAARSFASACGNAALCSAALLIICPTPEFEADVLCAAMCSGPLPWCNRLFQSQAEGKGAKGTGGRLCMQPGT